MACRYLAVAASVGCVGFELVHAHCVRLDLVFNSGDIIPRHKLAALGRLGGGGGLHQRLHRLFRLSSKALFLFGAFLRSHGLFGGNHGGCFLRGHGLGVIDGGSLRTVESIGVGVCECVG